MPVQPSTDLPVSSESNRKVWVENTWHEDYVEDFRGKTIRVPAKGRIEMNNLEANRFFSQVKGTYEVLPNGQYNGVPKALRIVEKDADKENVIEDPETFTCMKCGDTVATARGLKHHITSMHSDE